MMRVCLRGRCARSRRVSPAPVRTDDAHARAGQSDAPSWRRQARGTKAGGRRREFCAERAQNAVRWLWTHARALLLAAVSSPRPPQSS